MSGRSSIRVVGARQHNLQSVDVEIPKDALTVITGPSGSGKSSLAFDTVYAEGQRRYVESLSVYARQFLEQMQKPDVDRIEGLPPTIAIDQRAAASSPRSTVATTTEIHDFLRVLFARAGEPRCWKCDRRIVRQSTAQVVDTVMAGPQDQRIMVLSPIVQEQRGAHKTVLERVARDGFVRVRVDGEVSLLEDLDPLSPNRKHDIDVVVDRLTIKQNVAQRLADSVELATRLSGGRVIITAETKPGHWSDEGYSAALSCPDHADVRLDELSPHLFSFNSPHGACESCNGLGTTLEFDPELIVPDPKLSLGDGAIAPWRRQGKHLNAVYANMTRGFCERFAVLPDIPFHNIPAAKRKILLDGTTEADAQSHGTSFEGVIPNLRRRWETTGSESAKQRLHTFLSEAPCDACRGVRLRREALCVKVADRSIAEIAAMTIVEANDFLAGLEFTGEARVVAEPLLSQIRHRLRFLRDVGVEYLSLDRASVSLSGGEWQRIRLATQIGSGLAGVCYVLDEPTIGLHARDTNRLTTILRRLAQLDNTVVVVEHDEQVIAHADHVIDIGPGAGAHGGRVVAEGTLDDVLASPRSATARFLTGRSHIALPGERRKVDFEQSVTVYGTTANNLKQIDVRFPLGCFVCVTGVSGSGKSTLVTQVLWRALKRGIDRSGPRPGPYERISGASLVDKVIEINQSPIGRTPRSNPATYVGVFDLIRRLYTKTREAKIRGYGAARFSFNIKGGRCEACEGQGTKRIAMHFLPDVYVECTECGGRRYNRETLDVRYRGKTIADVLDMRIEEATEFFDNFANIRRRLQSLRDVGLGYMALGQPSNTLSGGEAQRVKLAAELHRSANGHTVYILDEPTTGLHYADVRTLLTVLNRLADRRQTVLVIEHNMDVIKVADWIIDLGPEGGDAGGYVVAEGTPEQIAACEKSHTGRYLKDHLAGIPPVDRWNR
ncbi:MAG: excinuclease ABC subunit UvrA [Phycisphaerae bacterium]|jgi:excinuclease ABC subunit A